MKNIRISYLFIIILGFFYCKSTDDQTVASNSVKCKKELIKIIKNKDRQKINQYLDKTFFADFYFNGIILEKSSKELISDILFIDDTMKNKFNYKKTPSIQTLLNTNGSNIIFRDELVIILFKSTEYGDLNYSLKISSYPNCILEGVNFENSIYE